MIGSLWCLTPKDNEKANHGQLTGIGILPFGIFCLVPTKSSCRKFHVENVTTEGQKQPTKGKKRDRREDRIKIVRQWPW
jgi:hypothetical protein